MGIYHLDRIFQPESVAVIGATETENSIGNALMTNLGNGGFSGEIVPINPKYSVVNGIKTLESIRQSSHPIDLAIIATPISTVPDIVDDCIAAQLGYKQEKGVIVAGVKPGSPAAGANIQRGDLIQEINQTPVDSLKAYEKVVRKGEKFLFLVRRGENTFFTVIKPEQ